MASESQLVRLLSIVDRQGVIEPLVREGLFLSQIAELLREAKRRELVIQTDNGLALSSSGREVLSEGLRRHAIVPRSAWIKPLEEARTPKLGTKEIYLPNDVPR